MITAAIRATRIVCPLPRPAHRKSRPGRGSPADLLARVRPEALAVPESGIVEVFNYGRNRQGLIPLWVGEGDLSTPSFISAAAIRSLEAGETFYTYQRGHSRAEGRDRRLSARHLWTPNG